jgi:hypothetical protein
VTPERLAAERLSQDDRAAAAADLYLAGALAKHQAQRRAAMPSTAAPVGICANCEAVVAGARWCDEDCRADAERRARVQPGGGRAVGGLR